MKLLMIATGYPPYLFSENLCNGKLVMAMMEQGIEVDVISRVDEGPSYGSEWVEPWDVLKPSANFIAYKSGNKLAQIIDTVYSGAVMDWNIQPGVRWMRRAYEKAVELIRNNKYDAVLTRSPNDIPHFIGAKLKQKFGIRWIANWNDPAVPIWPEPYTHKFTEKVQRKKMAETVRLLKAADINSFPSDSLRQHFIKHFPFLSESPTAVFPHIGLVEKYWPESASKSAGNKLRFLHSGNLSAERNPKTTFEAMRHLIDDGFTDFEFHIMGHINDYTQRMIDNYHLGEYVKCIGSFPYMEALSQMQAYDVLVLLEAQLEKGIFFASKFTDYLQAGKPILAISPAQGFAADMLSDRMGEYVAENNSVDSILGALKSIVENWKEGKLEKTDSSELFQHFSAAKVVNDYQSILK